MTMNKAQKLVKMLDLLYRRGSVRASEFKQLFDLDTRTFRRYLDDLGELGLPVIETGEGPDRSFELDPAFRRSGVQLTLPEVLSLHFGRRLFNFLEGTPFVDDMQGAIERLSPALDAEGASLLGDLDRRFIAVPEHAKDYRETSELIDELVTALIYQNPIRVDYGKLDGTQRDTTLEPYTLATWRQGLYLFARDRRDGRVKTFAVERFSEVERLRMEKFVVPDNYNPRDLIQDSFGITSGPVNEIAAVFEPTVAPFVRERRWHASQTVEERDDGRVRVRLNVGISEELIGWLLGFGADVRVEAPDSLVDVIRERHRRALERLA